MGWAYQPNSFIGAIMKKKIHSKHLIVTALLIIVILFQSFFHTISALQIKNKQSKAYSFAANEIVVTSASQLKTTLESDNGIDTIYLGADIQLPSTGIAVHNNKTTITIVGQNPADFEPVTYTLTDYSSLAQNIAIFINTGSKMQQATLKNVNIVGKNYYGTITVADTVRNVELVYDNIQYVGPQLTFNRWGTCKIIDSTIEITDINGGSPHHELAEASHLVFGGNTIVNHKGIERVFWSALQAGSITVLPESHVEITSLRSTLMQGYNSTFAVGKDAYFSFTGNYRVNENYFTSFYVEEGAQVYLNTLLNYAGYVLSVNGDVTISKNATFHINAKAGAYALLYVYGAQKVAFQDPKSVLLINPSNRIFQYALTAGSVSFDAHQINYWRTAGKGDLNDTPMYRYKKADNTNFVLQGNVAIGTTGNISGITTNYTEGDSPSSAPTPTEFHFSSMRVLSLGKLSLSIDPINQPSTFISGNADSKTQIHFTYLDAQGTTQSASGYAQDNNTFSITIPTPVGNHATVLAKAAYYYLFESQTVTADYGDLTFKDAPPLLEFQTTALSNQEKIVNRKNSDFAIVVSDTRTATTPWEVTVKVVSPLTSQNPGVPVLNDSLIFVDQHNTKHILSTQSETPIFHQSSPYKGEYSIEWAQNYGVLAQISPGKAYANTTYSATLQWNLKIAP